MGPVVLQPRSSLRGYPGGAFGHRRTARDRTHATTWHLSRFTRPVGTPRRAVKPMPRINVRKRAVMAPSPWPVPPLPTSGALAAWLEITANELDWLADCQGRLAKSAIQKLHHYTYRWLPKRNGKARLLEMPKQRLKAIQRRILREIPD